LTSQKRKRWFHKKNLKKTNQKNRKTSEKIKCTKKCPPSPLSLLTKEFFRPPIVKKWKSLKQNNVLPYIRIMKLLASEHFRKKLEKRKIISTELFFEKTRNPVKYEMMKNEKQFLKTQIEILQKMLLKTTRQLHKKRVKEIHLLKCNMKTLSNLLKMKQKRNRIWKKNCNCSTYIDTWCFCKK